MKARDFMAIAPIFTSDDPCRLEMKEPFRYDDHLFVTDGRIALVCHVTKFNDYQIEPTNSQARRNIGTSLIRDYIGAIEKMICYGRYQEFDICNLRGAVCAVVADIEPDMLLLRANMPYQYDPDDDGAPDSVQFVQKVYTAVIMANQARSVISGYYASLILGLVRHHGPVRAYADESNPEASLYFRGNNWRCVLMPLRIKGRTRPPRDDVFNSSAIGDAKTGALVHERNGRSVDIDLLRFQHFAPVPSVNSVPSKMAKCAGCGQAIDVRYDEYVEIHYAIYCPKCFVRHTRSEAAK